VTSAFVWWCVLLCALRVWFCVVAGFLFSSRVVSVVVVGASLVEFVDSVWGCGCYRVGLVVCVVALTIVMGTCFVVACVLGVVVYVGCACCVFFVVDVIAMFGAGWRVL